MASARLRRLRARARNLLRQWKRAEQRACRHPDSALILHERCPFWSALRRSERVWFSYRRADAKWRAGR